MNQPSTSATTASSSSAASHHDMFDAQEDFDAAFSQFATNFALTYQGLDSSTGNNSSDAAKSQPQPQQVDNALNYNHSAPNGTSASVFASLLNEKESWALTEFLDKVQVDPNFLFDPKLAEGLLDVDFDKEERDIDQEFEKNKTVGPHPPLAFSSDPNFPPFKGADPPYYTNLHHHQPAQYHQQLPQYQYTEQHPSITSAPSSSSPLSSSHLQSQPPPSMHYNPELAQAMANSVAQPVNQEPIEDTGKPKKRAGRRENLTVDQKRMNHISSEKKRRDLIKKQFDKMCSMVPTISDNTAANRRSKSDILMAVYEYMVHVIDQNNYIRQQLAENGVPEDSLPPRSTDPVPPQPNLYA